MAIVGLSEFTFGYGFLFEQTQRHWADLRVAPILPSLAQEADDAWDARLPLRGTDFYYQFKLSDYLERRNSLFHKDGTYESPYYRIAFHPRDRNRQHRRLWQHAQTNPNTFYVAPEFDSIDDFNSAFLAQRLAEHSRIIPLGECEDCNDGEQHYITFQSGSSDWIQHSTKKHKTGSYRGEELERVYRASAQRWRPIDENFAEAALRRTTEAVKQALADDESLNGADVGSSIPLLDDRNLPRRRGALIRRTAQVLSAFVGATMVLVGEPPQ